MFLKALEGLQQHNGGPVRQLQQLPQQALIRATDGRLQAATRAIVHSKLHLEVRTLYLS